MQKLKGIADKCGAAFVGLYKYSVSWIFFVILLFLSSLTFISTTILTRDEEGGHWFIGDHPIIAIIVIAVIIRLGLFIESKSGSKSRKTKSGRAIKGFFDRIKSDEAFFKKIRFRMLLVLGAVAVFWVLSSQLIPGADQYRIQHGVWELRIEDYTRYLPGEYFEEYQNQFGLLLADYFFSMLFGSSNHVVFALFNVAAMLLFYYELSELCGSFEFGRVAQLAVIVIGFAFYPLTIYCGYIYGTLIGLAFGVTAMELELKFFRSDKWRYAIGSAVMISLSVMIKSNYLIFLIAVGICAVIELIRKKKVSLVFLPLVLAAAAIISLSLPKAIIKQITNEPLDGGASSWGWIAMGLQEGPRAPGAFNEYNLKLYNECGYDSELHAELAKEEVRERMEIFVNDKAYAASFFSQKIAYEWSDPLFQFGWNIRGKLSQVEMPDWLWHFKSLQGVKVNVWILDPLMSVIYIGALLFCILCRDKTNIYTAVLSMTFIGGFMFHLFWEAGPRYTLPYFVLLFLFTVGGYTKAVQLISEKMHSKSSAKSGSAKEKAEFRKKVLSCVPYICITVILVGAALPYSGDITQFTKDNKEYAQWIKNDAARQLIAEGNYKIVTRNKKGITLGKEVSEESVDKSLALTSSPTALEVIWYQNQYWLSVPNEHLYLAVTNSADRNNQTVTAARLLGEDPNTNWTVSEAKNGAVSFIYQNRYALTYNEDDSSLYVSPYTGKQNQIWHLEKQ